jgi:hypothetical protein
MPPARLDARLHKYYAYHCWFRRIGFFTLQDLNRDMHCAHQYETLFHCYYCNFVSSYARVVFHM